MKKQAKDLKPGDKISISEGSYVIDSIELSEIGKHGKRKCRVVALNGGGEKIILIRPEDYPFETK